MSGKFTSIAWSDVTIDGDHAGRIFEGRDGSFRTNGQEFPTLGKAYGAIKRSFRDRRSKDPTESPTAT